ncbi:TetR/AcrR family transcriptional regulator [Sphingobium scionense]
MVQKRRVGAESSETRARIVEATEQVIRDEGYAAASSRRVALRAELPPSLVHYYFPSTDDLLLAVFRRGAEQSDAMIEAALTSADPVRALWRFFPTPAATRWRWNSSPWPIIARRSVPRSPAIARRCANARRS